MASTEENLNPKGKQIFNLRLHIVIMFYSYLNSVPITGTQKKESVPLVPSFHLGTKAMQVDKL